MYSVLENLIAPKKKIKNRKEEVISSCNFCCLTSHTSSLKHLAWTLGNLCETRRTITTMKTFPRDYDQNPRLRGSNTRKISFYVLVKSLADPKYIPKQTRKAVKKNKNLTKIKEHAIYGYRPMF